MTRAAIYARVSLDDGRQNLDAQLGPLREYVQRREWSAVEFEDMASGSDRRRPGLDGLMKAARRREVDAVVVVKLDRLGRSLAHLVQTLDEFRSLGVDFIAVDQGIDTMTPMGRLMAGFLGAIAEFERDMNRERTMAGLAAARRRGVKLGRKPVAVDEGRLRVLRESGASIRAIARALGCSVGRVHQSVRESGIKPREGNGADIEVRKTNE